MFRRRPKGMPTGGEFAAFAHAESEVTLDAEQQAADHRYELAQQAATMARVHLAPATQHERETRLAAHDRDLLIAAARKVSPKAAHISFSDGQMNTPVAVLDADGRRLHSEPLHNVMDVASFRHTCEELAELGQHDPDLRLRPAEMTTSTTRGTWTRTVLTIQDMESDAAILHSRDPAAQTVSQV